MFSILKNPSTSDQPIEKEFDAVIVGSGPGGATIARELSARKKKVLILERGANAPLKESFFGATSILSSALVGDDLVTTRAFTTGGTTAFYGAVAEFPPLDIFLSVGIDLFEILEEVKRELPLAPLPDELLGNQAIKVSESAVQLGYPWKKRVMLIDQSKCASGCTYRAKWTARNYVYQAMENGATLLNRAVVTRVLVEKQRAIGVEYKLWKSKKEFEVRQAYGTKIILAAGALISPIILRASGINDVVNHGFYCDPCFAVIGTVPGLKGRDHFAASTGTDFVDDINLGDAIFSRSLYRIFMFGNREYTRLFSHRKSIGVGVIVKDGLSGELRENGRYHKNLTKEEYEKLHKGGESAREIVEHAGGENIFQTKLSSARVGGLIRIREHVDEKLQTLYENLHVCDASVIPESIRLSPTITLICLGKFLAKQL